MSPQRQLGRVQGPRVLKVQDRWQVSWPTQGAHDVAELSGLSGPVGGDLSWGHPPRPGEVVGAPDQADASGCGRTCGKGRVAIATTFGGLDEDKRCPAGVVDRGPVDGRTVVMVVAGHVGADDCAVRGGCPGCGHSHHQAAAAAPRRRAMTGRAIRGMVKRISAAAAQRGCRPSSGQPTGAISDANLSLPSPRRGSPSVFDRRNTDQEFAEEELSVPGEFPACRWFAPMHAFCPNSAEPGSRGGRGHRGPGPNRPQVARSCAVFLPLGPSPRGCPRAC